MPERPAWLYSKSGPEKNLGLNVSKQMTVRDNYDSGPLAVPTELPSKLRAYHFACFQDFP